jgi:outer membrane protein
MMKKIFIIFAAALFSINFASAQDIEVPETDLEQGLMIEPREPAALSNTFLNRGLFSIEYNLSFPVGDLSDFISTIGYRGWNFELKGVINDNLAVGGSFGWYGFQESFDRDTYFFDAGSLTTSIYNYYYTIPLRVVAHYYFLPDSKVQPFAGLSIGTNYSEKRSEIGFLVIEDKAWDFGLTPEIGAIIPFGEMSMWGAQIKGRYNFLTYKDRDIDNIMFIDVSIGLVYSY